MGCAASTISDNSEPRGISELLLAPFQAPQGDTTRELLIAIDPSLACEKAAEFSREFDALPGCIRRSLANLQTFSATAFAEACTRPLSLISWLTAGAAAQTIGHGFDHFPSLLGALCRAVRKQGASAQLRKVDTLQFLHMQLQPSGALFRVAVSRPLLVIALCLSALTYNVSLSKTLSKNRSQTTGGAPMNRAGSTSRTRSAGIGRRRSTLHTTKVEAAMHFLSSTAYLQAWPPAARLELLAAVLSINKVGDPTHFSAMINSEAIDSMSDQKDECLLKGTLIMASHSHMMRKLAFHRAWCVQTAGDLQGCSVSAAGDDFVYCFGVDDTESERFVRAHSWVLKHIIIPFAAFWARLAVVPSAQAVCRSVERLQQTYEDSLRQKLSARGGSSSGRRSGPSMRKVLLGKSRKVLAKTDAVSTGLCPLLQGNRAGVEIPYDSVAMLSVCKMYNVNADELLYVRRMAKKNHIAV